MNMSKLDYVLDLGGSVVNPGKLNETFLSLFQKFISDYVAQGKSFGIVVGGGSIARLYQDFLRAHFKVTNDDLDRVGIRTTKLNAELVRIILKFHAYSRVLESPEEPLSNEPQARVFVFSGWDPGWKTLKGWSTDYIAALVAKRFGVKEVVSLSNTVGVYEVMQGKAQEGKLIRQLSWSEYEAMIQSEWTPGMKVPFDPFATKEAKAQGLRVVALRGENLENMRNYLEGKEFIGTVIE